MCVVTLLHSRTHWGLQGISCPLVQQNTISIYTLQSTGLFSNSRKKGLDDLYRVSWSQQLDNLYPPLDRGGVLTNGLQMLWFCSLSFIIKRVLVWRWKVPKEIVVLKLPVALRDVRTYCYTHSQVLGVNSLIWKALMQVWQLVPQWVSGLCCVAAAAWWERGAAHCCRQVEGGGVQVVSQTVLRPYAQFSLHDKLQWQYPAL